MSGEVDKVVEGEETRRRLFKVFPRGNDVGEPEFLRPIFGTSDRHRSRAIYRKNVPELIIHQTFDLMRVEAKYCKLGHPLHIDVHLLP